MSLSLSARLISNPLENEHLKDQDISYTHLYPEHGSPPVGGEAVAVRVPVMVGVMVLILDDIG